MEKCCPGEHALTDTGESADALLNEAAPSLAPALATVQDEGEGGKASQDAQD